MKRFLLLMGASLLVFALIACTVVPAEETFPEETTLPVETTLPPIPDGYLCLDQMVEGSGISVSCEGDMIILSEDGLIVELSVESSFICRNGYIVAVMNSAPLVIEGNVYVDEEYFNDILCEGDPSLFHGMMFFSSEILGALEQPEGSVFNQKLLEEILLPVSMRIDIPHIDMGRVFMPQPLSQYPDILAEELIGLGYGDAENYTYSEYVILSGTQTLAQAGITADMAEGITYDAEMTVAEYYRKLKEVSWKGFVDGLNEETVKFATEKQIELSDVQYLHRVFDEFYWGEFMAKPDEVLKAALEEYYAVDLDYLQSLEDAFSGEKSK